MRHHFLLALRDFCATVRPHQRAVIMLNCRSPVQSAVAVHAVLRYVAAAAAAEEQWQAGMRPLSHVPGQLATAAARQMRKRFREFVARELSHDCAARCCSWSLFWHKPPRRAKDGTRRGRARARGRGRDKSVEFFTYF